MRTSRRFQNGLCVMALAAAGAIGSSACGPDYAIYKVHVTSASPRDDVEYCYIKITNEKGEDVLKLQELEKEYTTDPGGGLALKQGCQGGLTKANVGYFSYSTSRSSGSLSFTVLGLDHDNNPDKPVQQAEARDVQVKAYPPEIEVNLDMQLVK
jgi:hypothetical protein